MTYPDNRPLPEPVFEPFDIVLKGSGPNMGFIKIETSFGHTNIKIGEWWTDDLGYRRLTIRPGDDSGHQLLKLAEKRIPFSLHFTPENDPYTGDWILEFGATNYEGFDPSGAVVFALTELAKSCQCKACQTDGPHLSDCAVHNEPAYPNGPCSCPVKRRLHSVVITEQGPEEPWLFNLDRYNSEDDVEISPEVGRAILNLIARDKQEVPSA